MCAKLCRRESILSWWNKTKPQGTKKNTKTHETESKNWPVHKWNSPLPSAEPANHGSPLSKTHCQKLGFVGFSFQAPSLGSWTWFRFIPQVPRPCCSNAGLWDICQNLSSLSGGMCLFFIRVCGRQHWHMKSWPIEGVVEVRELTRSAWHSFHETMLLDDKQFRHKWRENRAKLDAVLPGLEIPLAAQKEQVFCFFKCQHHFSFSASLTQKECHSVCSIM